VIYTASINAP